MWLWLLVGVAFAGKYADREADIVAERVVQATPEAVYAELTDLTQLQALFPPTCADWGGPFTGDGVGAKAIVTYKAGGMMRRLDAVVSKAEPSRLLDLDHPGGKGFVTRFELTPSGEGTRVKLTTFLNPPPSFVRAQYYNKVLPAWQGCHERTLSALDAAVSAGS